jgi:pyruvate/2-oxoglutarate dehydrogenase complex dihydrolipoamide acyltransferase (E2) component
VADIILPSLGFAVREATVLRWLKAPGDGVAAGDDLVEVASEKTIHVLCAAEGGTLLAHYALPGAIVEEGQPLGYIGRAGESAPPRSPRIVGWEAEVAPPPAGFRPAPAAAGGAAAHAPETFQKSAREVSKRQIRRVTGQRMAASWAAPKVDLFTDVDFTRVVAHREALKQSGADAPSYNMYIAHAAVRAFEDLPHLNRQWRGGESVPVDGIHVGVAVAQGENLVTVSMKNLAGLALEELQRRFKGLIRKALGMTLTREELYGSSLTITNLGEFDVTGFTAILNPPEIFILAIGALQERPAVRNGQIVPRWQCTFCLSFDHRAVDGGPAARLLQRIKHHLEHYGAAPGAAK